MFTANRYNMVNRGHGSIVHGHREESGACANFNKPQTCHFHPTPNFQES
jgi:hypothetical protein